MTYDDIRCFALINDTDSDRVEELATSMIENGWQGCPILVCGEGLLTGSHRLAALHYIAEMLNNDEITDEQAAVLNQDIAEDVTEIVEEHMAAFEEREGCTPDIDFQNIGWLLEGSWVEEYKNEITEW